MPPPTSLYSSGLQGAAGYARVIDEADVYLQAHWGCRISLPLRTRAYIYADAGLPSPGVDQPMVFEGMKYSLHLLASTNVSVDWRVWVRFGDAFLKKGGCSLARAAYERGMRMISAQGFRGGDPEILQHVESSLNGRHIHSQCRK